MPDIAMCDNEACPQRETCYRFMAVPDEYWQSVCHFVPDATGKCEYHWPVEEATGKVKTNV